MTKEQIKELLELLNKFENEPDFEKFFDISEQVIIDDVIDQVKAYKDFIGDDE